MKQNIRLPARLDGHFWRYLYGQKSGRNWPRHTHEELEVNLVTSGTGVYFIDKQRYELKPHTLVWLFSSQEHVLVQQSRDYRMWIIKFRPRLVEYHCKTGPISVLKEKKPRGEFVDNLPHVQAHWLERQCEEMEKMANDAPRYNAALGYFLTSCWSARSKVGITISGLNVHPAINTVIALVQEGFDGDEQELSERAGLSSWRLSRLFKQQTGVALSEFRNQQRLKRFLELYGEGQEYSLADAAEESGFGSYPQFYRYFCRAMGYSPRAHRQKLNGQRGS